MEKVGNEGLFNEDRGGGCVKSSKMNRNSNNLTICNIYINENKNQACYPVFTEPHTSSIGIDELQCLLLKNLLLMGVEFRLGVGFQDAKVVEGSGSGKGSTPPRWGVTLSYDELAQKKYGKGAASQEVHSMKFGFEAFSDLMIKFLDL